MRGKVTMAEVPPPARADKSRRADKAPRKSRRGYIGASARVVTSAA